MRKIVFHQQHCLFCHPVRFYQGSLMVHFMFSLMILINANFFSPQVWDFYTFNLDDDHLQSRLDLLQTGLYIFNVILFCELCVTLTIIIFSTYITIFIYLWLSLPLLILRQGILFLHWLNLKNDTLWYFNLFSAVLLSIQQVIDGFIWYIIYILHKHISPRIVQLQPNNFDSGVFV